MRSGRIARSVTKPAGYRRLMRAHDSDPPELDSRFALSDEQVDEDGLAQSWMTTEPQLGALVDEPQYSTEETPGPCSD